jgi:hypothetical protein
MLYGSKYIEVANFMKADDGINGIGVNGVKVIYGNGANGIKGANGIQTANSTKLINERKVLDALNGVAHT